MKKHNIIKIVWIMTILAISAPVFAANPESDSLVTPEGEKLKAHYSKMLADLKQQITRLEPSVDEKQKAEFTRLLGALEDVPPVTKIVMGTEREVKYGPGNPAFSDKQKEVLAASRAVMKDIETF